MQSTSISSSWHTCCYYPVPNNIFHHNPHHRIPSKITINSRPRNSQYTNHNVVALTATHSCSKEQESKQKHNHQENSEFLQDFCSSAENQEPHFGEGERERGFGVDNQSGISSNMGWAELKAALGQRINFEGIACSFGIFSKDKQLAIPHVGVPDIRYIDWAELKNRGFQGVVFDKDNTITVPYSLSLWAPLGPTIEQCKSLFGSNIAVFSNSAGLSEYDPDGRKAGALEDAIGIKVIRHKMKKPAGTAEEIENTFGCESSRLIMVGDRPFTDIVYGNRNGFLTILSEPLSHEEEPLIVRQVRLLEVALIQRWSKKGIMPISHKLVPDPAKCVKDVPI
ncbi:phosphatidylglycerophosphate phosphatase 1, chloroplastic/mitochondrial-like isoform X2 [Salvia miltiorrhiza]|uniref:phosphatidylglycerophosphate phosphatase 1, chloroplastic/mitochondrial-like isoform X2 n=1 Tax=Salvia miltiorrhiza TaxID=226208 RepID=UPI0025AB8E4A|nr:phosphatidylglycerophosphate phosphatase 1, chloroplastic/mitochondrial-like isoform X2 [Salvia miltiorrhiza]